MVQSDQREEGSSAINTKTDSRLPATSHMGNQNLRTYTWVMICNLELVLSRSPQHPSGIFRDSMIMATFAPQNHLHALSTQQCCQECTHLPNVPPGTLHLSRHSRDVHKELAAVFIIEVTGTAVQATIQVHTVGRSDSNATLNTTDTDLPEPDLMPVLMPEVFDLMPVLMPGVFVKIPKSHRSPKATQGKNWHSVTSPGVFLAIKAFPKLASAAWYTRHHSPTVRRHLSWQTYS